MLVVRSGASQLGPGGANEAEALAITDAAVMPQDKTVVGRIARLLSVPTSEVSSNLSVQAEAGTALVQVQYTARSAAGAIAGANAVAQVASGVGIHDQAIAGGSLAVVSRAATATRSGSVLHTWLPVGALLGLVAGVVAARVIEHADQRVDDGWSLGETTGGPVTVVPGGTSPAELTVLLDRAAGGRPYALVPLRVAQVEPAGQLARELRTVAALPHSGRSDGTVPVTAPFADAPDAVCRGEGPTVLVVRRGERRRVVAESVRRLAHLDRGPVWSVLVTRR